MTDSSGSPAKMTYDPEADAAYIELAPTADGQATVQVPMEGFPTETGAEMILDFNAAGHLLGIEILGASRVLPSLTR